MTVKKLFAPLILIVSSTAIIWIGETVTHGDAQGLHLILNSGNNTHGA